MCKVALTAVALLATVCQSALGQTILYVKADATGANNGTSWADAFTHPQAALTAAAPLAGGGTPVQIWVAAGTYMPTNNPIPADPRYVLFRLLNGISIYGGFAGTETSPLQRNVAANPTVLSGDLNGDDGPNWENTGENAYFVVIANDIDASARLDGVIIRGGAGSGMITGNSSSVVVGCTFVRNGGLYYGGGFAKYTGSALFVNCRFIGNRANGNGGGANLEGGSGTALINCLFSGNSATSSGGAITLSDNGTVINCTFTGNSAVSGGAIFKANAASSVINSVFYGDTAGQGAEIMVHAASQGIAISHCDIQGGLGGIPGPNVSWQAGNINVNPLFVDADGQDNIPGTLDDNLQLQPGSPCIDAGNSNALPPDISDVDTDGNTNEVTPVDGDYNARQIEDPTKSDSGTGQTPIVDMGAFERSFGHYFILTLNEAEPNLVAAIPEGGTVVIGLRLAWDPGQPTSVMLARMSGDANISIESGATLNFDSGNFEIPQQFVLAAAEDTDGINGQAVIRISALGYADRLVLVQEVDNDSSSIIFVRAGAAASGDGLAWATAFPDLESALSLARQSNGFYNQIWISAGTYIPTLQNSPPDPYSAMFRLRNGVAIYGGFSGTETSLAQRNVVANVTVLSGDLNGNDGPNWENYADNTYFVVGSTGLDSSARLDGVTIRGAKWSGMGAGTSANTLVGCTFFRNGGLGYGGGFVKYDGSALFVNCRFIGNRASGNGGGANLEGGSGTALINCLFSGNSATSSGGAITLSDNGTVINCTFTDNSAVSGGAIFKANAASSVINSVFYGDTAGQGAEIMVHAASQGIAISHCDIQGGLGGIPGPNVSWQAGNINVNPLFVDADGQDNIPGTLDDNLQLQPGSPCIDAGNSSAVTLGVDTSENLRRFDDANVADSGTGIAPFPDLGAYEFGSTPIPSRLYVSASAVGTQLGTSWSGSLSSLPIALNTALAAGGRVSEIWVAGGTYRPAGPGGERSSDFRLLSSLGLYGHFASTESALAERDLSVAANASILSGDLNGGNAPLVPGQAVPSSWNDDSFHVVSAGGTDTTAVLDGFTIEGGYANDTSPAGIAAGRDRGAGLYLAAGRPTLRNIKLLNNVSASEGGGLWSDFSRPQIGGVRLVDDYCLASAAASGYPVVLPVGSAGVLSRNQVYLSTPPAGYPAALVVESGTPVVPHTLECRSTQFDGPGGLYLADNAVLRVTNSPSYDPTILRTTLTGLGDIVIDAGQVLRMEAGAVVDLSGQLPNQGCADSAQSLNWGRILVNGLLVLTDSTVQNANVDVLLADLQGVTFIVNNDCHLLSSVNGSSNSVPFGGEFFVSGTSVVQCNVIESDGDRYLDLDPDPNAVPRPTIGQGSTGNKISVNIRQGTGLDQGELLELRSVDWDFAAVGGGQSGAWQLASSAGNGQAGGGGYTDTWVQEKLEVFPNAKVNLTNRQGFVFQNPAITIPEALYVKTIKLHPGAVLNTGLQRMYYQNVVDENDVALTVNPNDPHGLLTNGSRMVDVPLLGFSLKVIAMEDETEFAVRLRTRLRDSNDVQPPTAPFKEGEVIRVAAPLPGNAANHAMAMRTSKMNCLPGSPPCPSATSIAAHGAFARSGEAQIEVKFNYKFCGQATDELIIYLSDSPDVLSGGAPSASLIEVARLSPPASGPGSIGSSDFASFSGRFARGALNFTRGTYVELELRGENACILIDDFDPVVCLWCACGDFSGEGACGVESLDYLYLLSEYGNSVNATNLCADQMGLDHYVDLSDLMNWSSGFHDPTVLDLCAGTAGASSGNAAAAIVPGGMVVAGKPMGDGQNDSLYPVNAQTSVAGTAIPSSGQHNGQRSGNGPLVKDNSGALHQLHGVMGLIRLSDGQVRLAPKTFNNVSLPNVTSGSTVRVGLSTGGGYALLDAAFDPSDPTGNTLFVLPIQVDPPGSNGSACPYRAAAKLQLTGNGNCNLLAIHGLNPAIGSTVVSTSIDCSEIVFAPDASRMRELDVDAYGNLFVVSAQGVNDNNYVLIHPTGTTSEIRVPLAGQVQAPTALHVQGDYLYVSTSQDGPDTTNTIIHRYTISRSGNAATGINTTSGHAVIAIPGIRFLTAITTNSTDGRLYALGFGSLSCSREACNADPDCPLGCHFNPGDPIFTTPMIAAISNPTAATPTVTTSAITGSTLGLPISLAFAGTACGTGDLDNNGQTNSADIAPFVQALLNPTPGTLCPADTNHDNTLNGNDIQPFVRQLIGG